MPDIKYLMKSQAYEVFEVLRSNGWNPADFSWEEIRSPSNTNYAVSRLVHQASGYYFIFDNYEGFLARWSPDNERESGSGNPGSWRSQIAQFNTWLGYLKREIEAPDVWGAISQETQVLEAASDEDNTPFTKDEKTYIRAGIDEIEQYLLTAHKLDPELIESRLKYLVESSERLGRKDWKNLLLATLVSIIIQAAVSPEAAREIFRFVGAALIQILQHGPLLLP